MILTHSMLVCHAQHLVISFQGQSYNFDSNYGKNYTFTEYGHIAYQIKGNNMYDNIQVYKYFALTHTLDPWGGVKGSKHFFFCKRSCCISNVREGHTH